MMAATAPGVATQLPARLVAAAAFLLPALSLSVPSGYSWGALLLVVAGLLSMGSLPGWRQWPKPLLAFGAVIAGMACLWAADAVWREPMTANAMDRPLKYLLALLAIPALRHGLPNTTALRWGCWVGAWSAGATAAWQVGVLEWDRAWGYTNAIQFGDVALLLALWSWALLPCTSHRGAIWIGRGAVLAGLYATVASGSRGAWVVAPVLMVALWWWQTRSAPSTAHPTTQTTLTRLRTTWPRLAVAVALAALLAAQWGPVGQRLTAAMTEWTQFQEHNQSENSVGQRLAHWQLAWRMGWEKPGLGWGQMAYDAEKLRRVQAAQEPEVLLHFGHAHHEWLDMWVKKGLSGLVWLTLFFAVPGLAYWHALRHRHGLDLTPGAAAAAVCGGVTVLGYLGFGMTQVLFAHNSGNVVYLFMNLLWLAALFPAQAVHAGERAA